MTVLFLLSIIMLFLVVLFYPKSEKKEDLFAQITLAVFMIMEVHTLWGYITLEIFKIGFELSYYVIYNFSLSCIIILYWIIIKRRKIQKFCTHSYMWITLGMLFVITLLIGLCRYGIKLNLFAYCSADSADHFIEMQYFIYAGEMPELNGRFFLHLNEALFLLCVQSIVQPMSYYRVFLIFELVFFFFSGAMFYALIQKYINTNKNILVGIFCVLIYVLGYPLNNLLYGYEYLGAAVSIAIQIEYLLERLVMQQKKSCDVIASILIACFAMYHCYSLLFVAILIGICIFYCINTVQKFTYLKLTMLVMVIIFVGYKFNALYNFWQMMLSKLETEAIMYRDLWSNIFWMIPAIIIGLKKCIKNKEKNVLFGMFLGIIITMIIFNYYMINNKISSYYFYKFYFLLWFWCMYVGFIGITDVQSNILVSYIVAIILITVVSNTSLIAKDDKVFKNKNYLDIYTTNWNILSQKEANIDLKQQELFYAAAEKVTGTAGYVPYIGTWEPYLAKYYYALTGQVDLQFLRDQMWYVENLYPDIEDAINRALQRLIYDKYYVPYIMVERNSDAYWYGIGYYSTLEVVYENEYGFIYKR